MVSPAKALNREHRFPQQKPVVVTPMGLVSAHVEVGRSPTVEYAPLMSLPTSCQVLTIQVEMCHFGFITSLVHKFCAQKTSDLEAASIVGFIVVYGTSSRSI